MLPGKLQTGLGCEAATLADPLVSLCIWNRCFSFHSIKSEQKTLLTQSTRHTTPLLWPLILNSDCTLKQKSGKPSVEHDPCAITN